METSQHAPRSTIAWLIPSGVDRAVIDVFDMTPPEIRLAVFTNTVAVSMMEARQFDAVAFDRDQRDVILRSVRDLAQSAHPDFTAVTGDLIQAAMGVRWDMALRDAVSEVTGTASTTAMTAVTDALTFLGVRRVAVATPFRDEQNVYVRRYLEEAGFEVGSLVGHPTHSVRDVRALPPDAPETTSMKAFEADRTAQAVFIACPVWRVGPFIDPLEQACGVPVLTVLNTFVWRGLTALEHPGNVRGYGHLLQNALAQPTKQSAFADA